MGNLEKYDVIFLLKDSAKLLEELTGELNDLSKRIVLIKNIELFDETINFSLSDMQQLIVSGDIEQCTYKTKLLINKYKSSIYFSPLAGITLPPLQHYSGYLKSTEFEGVVNLE